MKALEIRLQHINVKHNEQLAEIQEEKELLNLARRERVIYSNVFKGIEKDAIVKQRELMKLIKQNELLKEELSFLQENLSNIEQMAQNEQANFMVTYQNLFDQQRRINQSIDQQISTVETNKSKEYDSPQTKKKAIKTDESIDENKNIQITEGGQTKRPVHQQSTKVLGSVIANTEDKLQEFERAFEKLYIETGVRSTDKIIHMFQNNEQAIDDIYSEINQLNSLEIYQIQIEDSEREVQMMDKELKYYNEFAQNQKLQVENVKKQQEVIKNDEKASLEKKIDQNKSDVNKMKVMKNLIKILHQNDYIQLQKALNIFVLDEDTNEWNLSSYSRQLEEKINNILTVAMYLDKKEVTNHQSFIQKSFVTTEGNEVEVQNDKQQRLDDILNNLEKVKEAERITSKHELQLQSIQIIEQRETKRQKKSKL